MNNRKNQKYIMDINIELIEANKNQPRKEFDDDSLRELSNSIKEYGLIQPILVREKNNKKYEIVAGERRWRASKLANLKEIPCIVKKLDDEKSSRLALIENVQREDLNSIEEANAYKKLMDDYSLTQEDLSNIVGKSRSYIANTLRLLNLNDGIAELIEVGKLSSGHGRALLGIKDKKEQENTAQRIIKNRINVRETERMVREKKEKKKNKIVEREPQTVEIEEELMRTLGTRVKLVTGKEKGRIEIEYYGEEDLIRIIDQLLP